MHLKAGEKLKAGRGRVDLEGMKVAVVTTGRKTVIRTLDKEEQMRSSQFMSGEDIWAEKTGAS